MAPVCRSRPLVLVLYSARFIPSRNAVTVTTCGPREISSSSMSTVRRASSVSPNPPTHTHTHPHRTSKSLVQRAARSGCFASAPFHTRHDRLRSYLGNLRSTLFCTSTPDRTTSTKYVNLYPTGRSGSLRLKHAFISSLSSHLSRLGGRRISTGWAALLV